MPKQRHVSIRKKLITTFLTFATISVVLLGALFFTSARKELQSVHIAQLENIADLKKDRIELYFRERQGDIVTAANAYDIKRTLPLLGRLAVDPSDPAFRETYRKLDIHTKQYRDVYGYLSIILTDTRGRIVYVSPESQMKERLGKHIYPENAFAEGKKDVYFSDILRNSAAESGFEIMASAPVRDARGAFAGVIAFEMDMTPVYKLFQDTTGLGRTGEELIVRREGSAALFLSPLRYDPDAVLKKKALFDETRAFPAQMAVQGRRGAGLVYDYNGVEVLAAWRYVPSLRWGLVAKINAAEAFQSVVALRNMVIAIAAGIIVLGVLAAMLFARSFSAPIMALQKGAEMISSGNLDYRVGITSNDEIGRLAAAFDNMASSLGRTTGELRRKATALETSNMELEAFSYSVSHDLRAPLRGIDGFSLVLLEDYAEKLDNEGRDALERIRAASQRMGLLIDDLLKLSRVSRAELKRERVNLSKIAGRIAEDLRKTGPGRCVEFVIADGITHEGDERLLSVVLQNLLGNAWKFTEKHENARIEFGMADCHGAAAYFVRDDGAGFDPSYSDKLFMPFQRLHAMYEFSGTGIGLATVQRIISRHGGRVWAEGEVGKGACFYFTLDERDIDEERHS